MLLRRLTVGGLRAAGGIGLLLAGACGQVMPAGGSSSPRPTLNLSTLGTDNEATYFETFENNLLQDPEYVEVDAVPRVVRGNISGTNDVDVFDIGPVARGTRIVVDLTTAGTLDGAIALFDNTGAALLVNDHRNVYLGRQTPFVDVVARRDSQACYIAVSATPGYAARGDYALQASKAPSQAVPNPRPQTVLLTFTGGSNVRIGSRSPVQVPPFDAADINPVFGGMTATLMAEVVDRVREDYAGLDATILSTSEGDRYESGMTRIFFGTFDPALLGVAEGVDEYNAAADQVAIIFTDTFSAFMQLDPTVEQMGQALANVATHEIGHLLGLIHTSDPEGIMDVTASLNQLMIDQTFRGSRIYDDVFPVGFQDAPQLLLDTLGGELELAPFKGLEVLAGLQKGTERSPGVSARNVCMLSTCGLGARAH